MTSLEQSSLPSIAENLASVRERIGRAAARSGRREQEVILVAVSKTKPLDAVLEALAAGHRVFGENRVQEATAKIDAAPAEAEWHMIGHLQSNKARFIPGRFQMVQSVDSERLARALARLIPAEQTLDIMIQLNWSHEGSKSGIGTLDALRQIIAVMTTLPTLALTGLMTIPDPSYDEARTRAHFAEVRELHEQMRSEFHLGSPFRHLSMGMTHDFEWAVEEGATVIRVGTAIFGARP